MHRTARELAEGLGDILAAPRGEGRLARIVRRPRPGEREVMEAAELDEVVGLVGDRWSVPQPEKPPHPEKQITIMSARVIRLIAGDDWAPAGDQLFVDMDVTEAGMPVGARLSIGGAELVVTEPPHTGCKKFAERFGLDALVWSKAPENAHLRLRGLHARVVRGGTVRTGDLIATR